MTSPEEAPVVPITLTVDGRTGYTIWAAPWTEDGEEWQAFLGAGSRVFVFEDLDDMAGFIASNKENDLSDHPSWAMLQTLPADQLTPDAEYHFDLDAVPGLTEREVTEDLVGQVGDVVDMVTRIAECCDNGPLLGLLAGPGFVALLDTEPDTVDAGEKDEDEEGEDEREDAADRDAKDDTDKDTESEDTDTDEDTDGDQSDDPWQEIGAAVRRSWPLLIQRLDDCLAWYEAGDRPETTPVDDEDSDDGDDLLDAASARELAGRAVTDEDDEADEDAEEQDDEEEDEETGPDAGETAQFWDDIGIMPVRLATPAGEGYTLRCYVDDEARFLGSDLTVDVFATPEELVQFCQSDEEHDLSELETWSTVRETDPLPLVVPPEDAVDLIGAEAQLLAGPYGANPVVVRRAVDFLLDVAEYCELEQVREALNGDGELAQGVSAVLHPSVGGLYPVQWSGGQAASRWREVVAEVETCLRFRD